MPWKESRILDQRLQFLSSVRKEEMSLSDQLWCMDCKGYFTSGDGARCDPFTDAHSQYLIRCQTVLRMN